MPSTPLVDRLQERARKNPVVALVVLTGTVVGALGSFTDSVEKIRAFFSKDEKTTPSVVVQIQSPPETPAKKTTFSESFSLGERDAFVSNHGVTVRTGFIMLLEGQGVVADVGASASGPVEYMSRTAKGDQIKLHRSDCDSLTVLIRDVRMEFPEGIELDTLTKLGTGAEGTIKRAVEGFITGRCEQ